MFWMNEWVTDKKEVRELSQICFWTFQIYLYKYFVSCIVEYKIK